MLTLVMIVLTVAALIRPSASGLLFAVVTVAFDMLLSDLPGMIYYVAASSFDLLLMILLYYACTSWRSRKLIVLSGVSLCVNACGWVAWAVYYPPTIYNATMIVIAMIGVVIVAEDGDDLVVARLDCDCDSHHSSSDTGNRHNS